MSLTEVHGRLANSVLFFFIALTLWGIFRFFRKQGINSNYFGALVIGEVLVLAQMALGIYLWVVGLRPERGAMHILYGIVAALAIPAVYAYTKGQEQSREMMVYGAVLLFTVGIVLRAIATGG